DLAKLLKARRQGIGAIHARSCGKVFRSADALSGSGDRLNPALTDHLRTVSITKTFSELVGGCTHRQQGLRTESPSNPLIFLRNGELIGAVCLRLQARTLRIQALADGLTAKNTI